MGAGLGAECTEIVPNTVQHEIRKLQKNKAGHALSNGLSHLLRSPLAKNNITKVLPQTVAVTLWRGLFPLNRETFH
jgi:hypothetical protein